MIGSTIVTGFIAALTVKSPGKHIAIISNEIIFQVGKFLLIEYKLGWKLLKLHLEREGKCQILTSALNHYIEHRQRNWKKAVEIRKYQTVAKTGGHLLNLGIMNYCFFACFITQDKIV